MQRAAEEAALQNAVTNAVKLRRQLGAFTGAVEAKSFSLPNPGGGRELLENASFTLTRGRIYALIGRNSTVKVPLWQGTSSASAPPQGAPGGSGQLGTPRMRPAHRAPSHRLGCSS